MTTNKERDIYLQAITMIDPASGWIEIHFVLEVRADLVANQLESVCLNRCQLPDKIMVDR